MSTIILLKACIFKNFVDEIEVLLLLIMHADFCLIWLRCNMLKSTVLLLAKTCF